MNRSAQKEQFAHIFVSFKRMCVTDDVGCTANPVLHQIVAFLRIVLCARLSIDLRLKQDWKSFQSSWVPPWRGRGDRALALHSKGQWFDPRHLQTEKLFVQMAERLEEMYRVSHIEMDFMNWL